MDCDRSSSLDELDEHENLSTLLGELEGVREVVKEDLLEPLLVHRYHVVVLALRRGLDG